MLLVRQKLWEKATTKKRKTILMKETKIKTSSLSLTLKPGNKILVPVKSHNRTERDTPSHAFDRVDVFSVEKGRKKRIKVSSIFLKDMTRNHVENTFSCFD